MRRLVRAHSRYLSSNRTVGKDTIFASAGCETDALTGAVVAPLHLSTTYERDADTLELRGHAYR